MARVEANCAHCILVRVVGPNGKVSCFPDSQFEAISPLPEGYSQKSVDKCDTGQFTTGDNAQTESIRERDGAEAWLKAVSFLPPNNG